MTRGGDGERGGPPLPGPKGEVRAARRAARREIVAGRDLDADAVALADHLLSLVPAVDRRVVLSYAALPHEPPTSVVNARLRAAGHRVLLPITLPSFDLDWHDLDDPAAAPFGPDTAALADLVLAPGLSVDATGTRLGQGGGCYDRVLPRLRPGTQVVVLLHPGELLPADGLPREEHDVPVRTVATAEGLAELALTPPGRPSEG